MSKLTEAELERLRERYVGGMGGLSEEAYACAPDVLRLMGRVEELEAALTRAVAHGTEEESLKWAAITREAERQAVIDQLRVELKKAHRYSLPNENGEGWAIVFLDDSGCFAGLSDWGNVAYRWNQAGLPDGMGFREFLLTCDDGYLLSKLGQGRKEYDAERTLVAVKEAIISDRRGGYLDKYAARNEWERLAEFGYLNTEYDFSGFCTHTHLGGIEECSYYRYVSEVTSFVKKVMPRLRKSIADDLHKESKP